MATDTFGPPDIVCANSGIHEHEDWLSEEYLEKEIKWPSAHVNFLAVLNSEQTAQSLWPLSADSLGEPPQPSSWPYYHFVVRANQEA